ncbi:MAG: DUF3078 domain-containing protein [Bacteroidota bacterium]
MKAFLAQAILLLAALPLAAQDQPAGTDLDREKRFREQAATAPDTSQPSGWRHGLAGTLNLSQVSYRDWAPGGENALSWAVLLAGHSTDSERALSWANSYRLAFGQARLGSQGLRKTDDELYFESLLIYRMGVHINPYGSVTLRTQFAPGFTYDNAGTRTQVSGFFDPAYLTQSAGAAYRPVPELITRLGLAAREVVTSDHTGYSDDPDTPGEREKFRLHGGMESVTELQWEFAANMTVSARLELFSPFRAPDRIILRSDNGVTAKVNRYVTVVLSAQVVGEPDISPRTQIKQTLALGLTYTLL